MSGEPGATGRRGGSLRGRLLLLVVFALLVQGAFLGLLWGLQSADRIRDELRSRGRASAATLALAARAALQFEDEARMEELLRGILEQDPDVLYVCFTRPTQEILTKRVRGEFAQDIDSIVRLAKTAPSKTYGFPEDDPQFLDIWEKVVTVRERGTETIAPPPASETELFGPAGPSAPAGAGPVGEYTWGYVHIGMSLKSTTEAARRGVLYALGTTLLTVLIASAAAFVLSNRIAAPLGEMLRVALRIARGDYSQSIEVQGSGEVRGLAEAFRGMQGNLHEIARQARSIAEGDLTRRVDAEGDLASAFNEMVRSLSMLVGQIQQAGFQIAAASNEILAATRQQEHGSQEQSASISETTSTMDELLSASKQIALSADAVAKVAEATLAAAREGQESVREAIRGMEEIRENHRATAQRILELSERNQQIGAIVEIIDDIADKTDILAVNAAIEGAKAGEAGKGFAVVASELRKLAEDVVISTREIREIVSEIQKASQASVSATESQMRITESGMELSVRTGERLQRILEGVQQTTEASRQISLATQQQRTGTEQVVTSMSEISKIAKQNVAVSGQTTASTRQLSALADDLRRAVSRFRLARGSAGEGPPDRPA